MKYITLILIMLGTINFSSAQSKTVKLNIDSKKVYLRYFYKSNRNSTETINDSVHIVCRKITPDKFYLDKFINKQKEWTRIYRIELASDSLNVTTRVGDRKGYHKLLYSKELYYNSFQINK